MVRLCHGRGICECGQYSARMAYSWLMLPVARSLFKFKFDADGHCRSREL